MMYRKFLRILICVLFINFFIPFQNLNAMEKKLLILNDGYKNYGEKTNILQEIIKTTLSMKYEIKSVTFNNFNDVNFNEYDSIIILKNDHIDFSDSMINKIKDYKDKILVLDNSIEEERVIGIKGDTNKFIKLSELDENLKAKAVKEFIYNNLNHEMLTNNTYLILDEMYPIDELNDVIVKIDYLYNLGIPFIVSAMPIFNNEDIEAVERYYEVLRYAQAKGGSIVLHFPDVNKEGVVNINIDNLINKMTTSYKYFINYQVYPRAIDIPEEFLYHDRINDYLKLTDTLFLDSNKISLSKDNINLKHMNNLIEKIPYDDFYNKLEYKNNLGISITSNIDFDKFKNILQSLNKREIYFNDFSYLDTYLNMGENQIESKEANLYLNNKNINVQRFISREEFKSSINKDEKIEEENTIDLSNFNKWLIIITSLASIIFIIIAIRNRRIDRNKFFK